MKIKKLISLITSAIIAISFISLTSLVSFADNSNSVNLNYKSSWYDYYSSGLSLSSINESGSLEGICYYIEDYETYKVYESKKLIKGYDKSFFNENMLIVNWLLTPTGKTGDYENLSVIKEKDSLIFNYKYYMSFISYPWIMYDINFIEFKKSDVANVDFSSIKVNVTETYSKAQQLVDPNGEPVGTDPSTIPDENRTINMKFIKMDLPKDDKTKTTTTPTVQKPTKQAATIKKPAKVTKVKLKSLKKKQLKVTWKKIKGAKYQVQYSLKKSMKKAKTKKNIKKNNVTLKKLKSNKKYYVRVRAYKKIGNKTYLGKWSKKAVKTVKTNF